MNSDVSAALRSSMGTALSSSESRERPVPRARSAIAMIAVLATADLREFAAGKHARSTSESLASSASGWCFARLRMLFSASISCCQSPEASPLSDAGTAWDGFRTSGRSSNAVYVVSSADDGTPLLPPEERLGDAAEATLPAPLARALDSDLLPVASTEPDSPPKALAAAVASSASAGSRWLPDDPDPARRSLGPTPARPEAAPLPPPPPPAPRRREPALLALSREPLCVEAASSSPREAARERSIAAEASVTVTGDTRELTGSVTLRVLLAPPPCPARCAPPPKTFSGFRIGLIGRSAGSRGSAASGSGSGSGSGSAARPGVRTARCDPPTRSAPKRGRGEVPAAVSDRRED
mmetsp:Transcript_6346/g.26321  ORF Transcript_6346/g.26321 Transcript_6346/m.26321 type:complete len:353 (-) Transcript_6346:25-1083(-)